MMVLFYGLPKQAWRGPSMIEHHMRNRISLNSVDNFRSPLIIINGCFGRRNYWERSNPTRFCHQLPHVFTTSSDRRVTHSINYLLSFCFKFCFITTRQKTRTSARSLPRLIPTVSFHIMRVAVPEKLPTLVCLGSSRT